MKMVLIPDNVAVYATYWTWPRFTVPTVLWQFGGGVVSDDLTTATLDSEESIAAVQYIHDLMYKYHVMNRYQPGTPYGGEPYENNGIALWWEGTWTGGFMRDRPEVAAVTQPMFINSYAPDGNQAVKFDSHIFSIPTGADDEGREQSYAMIKYLLENGAYWATSGQVPALKSVQALPEVQEIESVAVAADEFNQIGRTDTAHPAFIEIQTAWETAIGNALATEDADIEKALSDGAEADPGDPRSPVTASQYIRCRSVGPGSTVPPVCRSCIAGNDGQTDRCPSGKLFRLLVTNEWLFGR